VTVGVSSASATRFWSGAISVNPAVCITSDILSAVQHPYCSKASARLSFISTHFLITIVFGRHGPETVLLSAMTVAMSTSLCLSE